MPDEIILENDLDFSHVTLEFPLGGNADACSPFGGVLDGNGHSIKELFMENESSPSVGLFCGLKNATIKNLVIDESCSFAGRVACALSPFVTGNVSVINVTNRASVTGGECAGGFFGSVSDLEHSTVSFDDCMNIGNITNSSYAGGFIGKLFVSQGLRLNISNSVNNGNINGTDYVGGFVGYVLNKNGGGANCTITVVNATNHGNVTSTRNVGGFVGSVESIPNFTLAFSDSTNTGCINGFYVGGLIGFMYQNTDFVVNISNCKNNANLTASSVLGGLIGISDYNDD